MSNGRLTIGDLARRLDLSPAAVSYALNGRPGVSQETRDRVQALAQELGWYPSSSARALSQARSGSIGMVLSRSPELIGTEPYYMQVMAGVESVLVEADMSLLLRMVNPESGDDLAVYERWAGEARVDGVIVFDEVDDDPRLPLLAHLGLPAVVHGGPSEQTLIPHVPSDDEHVARVVVETVAALGHTELMHLTGPAPMRHEQARRRHTAHHAQTQGLRYEAVEGDYTLDGARDRFASRLREGPMPSALVCSNDLMSIGAFQAIEEAGLRIPADISLISWDDSMLCSISRPGITALDRQAQNYGRLTAQTLLAIIGGQCPTPRALTSELVTRGSIGPAPQRAAQVAR